MTTDAHADHFRHGYTRDKRDLITRLRRMEGQARGIQRLVDEEAYCLDVLQQVEALTARPTRSRWRCWRTTSTAAWRMPSRPVRASRTSTRS